MFILIRQIILRFDVFTKNDYEMCLEGSVYFIYTYTYLSLSCRKKASRYPFIDAFRIKKKEENKTISFDDSCMKKNRYSNDNVN